MKRKTILFFSLLMAISFFSLGQVEVDVKGKVVNEADGRANQHTDNAIDNAFDKLEDGIGSLFKKKKKKNKNKPQAEQSQQSNSQPPATEATTDEEAKSVEPEVKWNKFDFVPGDEVIFEDGPSADEENGEFPSRWDLYTGNAEIGEVDGELVIMFLDGGQIIPYLKNSEKDYLPEVFTIEFDVYFKKDGPYRYWLSFVDKKNQNRTSKTLEIYVNGLDIDNSNKRYPDSEGLNWNENHEGRWRHISVAFTKGKMKAYMDDTRLINIPHFDTNPSGITISAENGPQKYLKNIRIAKGGVKYYDRVLSDGKIIVNGIRFDVSKASIKPESNGAINKIYSLMNKQTELNFSVEGHTDSDGDDAKNMELSKERGKAVMERLISLGISADRLKSTGWGESKPLADNGTAEGKANNRRVEFVKF